MEPASPAKVDKLRNICQSADDIVIPQFSTEILTEKSLFELYMILADDSEYTALLESADSTGIRHDSDTSKLQSTKPNKTSVPNRRYSIMCYDPPVVLTATDGAVSVDVRRDGYEQFFTEPDTDDSIEAIQRSLPSYETVGVDTGNAADSKYDGGLVGYISYDAVYNIWLEELGVEPPNNIYPDAEFMIATKSVVYDHDEDRMFFQYTPIIDTNSQDYRELAEMFQAEHDQLHELIDHSIPELGGFELREEFVGSVEPYVEAVERAKEAIRDGEAYQVVVSRERVYTGNIDVTSLYHHLRKVNPSPYMYLIETPERSIAGASPESLIMISGDEIITKPVAGTCPRGRKPEEDRKLAGQMLSNEKQLSEHTMLVDLARNDVRRVGRQGSVSVEDLMQVISTADVQHLESTVAAELRDNFTPLDAVSARFPAGTLSGAPKLRAMEVIDELEETHRGMYGGAIGYQSWNQNLDFAIVIRTAVVEHGDTDRVRIRAGAGIVADSKPVPEYIESENKMQSVVEALDHVAGPDVSLGTLSESDLN
jgi:anthranilate synthase component 1